MSSDDFPEWLVEMVAKAIFLHPNHDPHSAFYGIGEWEWEPLPEEQKQFMYRHGRAVLTAIRESGLRLTAGKSSELFAPPKPPSNNDYQMAREGIEKWNSLLKEGDYDEMDDYHG